jgi:glycosyltransferase involved in cell wall biosynthesis
MLNKCMGRNAIHLVGAKYNVNDYYLSSDIVVGTGRVAIEAMSCGKPVIATGNTGYVGIVNKQNKDIQWQLYFGDHGSVKELDQISIYKDMKYLVRYKKTRIEIGNWGSAWFREMFIIDKVASDTVTIYREVLKNEGLGNTATTKTNGIYVNKPVSGDSPETG